MFTFHAFGCIFLLVHAEKLKTYLLPHNCLLNRLLCVQVDLPRISVDVNGILYLLNKYILA